MDGDLVDRRSRWQFESRESGWIWTVSYPDGATEVSPVAHPTLKECAADAARHGYVAWKPEAERRRSRVLGVTRAIRQDGAR